MTRLYWSEEGMIDCAEHAPMEGSDTWRSEHWEEIPAQVVKSEGLVCEVCALRNRPRLSVVR